jgi:hypothetical protein
VPTWVPKERGVREIPIDKTESERDPDRGARCIRDPRGRAGTLRRTRIAPDRPREDGYKLHERNFDISAHTYMIQAISQPRRGLPGRSRRFGMQFRHGPARFCVILFTSYLLTYLRAVLLFRFSRRHVRICWGGGARVFGWDGSWPEGGRFIYLSLFTDGGQSIQWCVCCVQCVTG